MKLQDGVYVLLMGDMRNANYETLMPVACSTDRDRLTEAVRREQVGAYVGPEVNQWGLPYSKSFRQGGPFEWFNAGTQKIVRFQTPEPPEVPSLEELGL